MSDLDAIRDRVELVDLVGETVQLQRSGRTYKGRCPFHNERTPSFIVSPERRSWHCFGACATGGDIFSFVMRRDNVDFGEAVRLLAARAGVQLQGRSSQPDPVTPRLILANAAAAQFFHNLLLNAEEGAPARAYATARGLNADAIRDFEIGYAAEGWDTLGTWLRGQHFEPAELVEAGLLVEGERGVHDRFRGRLMFPIREAGGRVVGFGGRALGDGMPKYLNSPQSRVFDKGALLYALDRASDAIRRDGRAVMVEGYLDAIAAHQYGYKNVVATMGTALNERHITLLRRYTRSVVLALDADEAGVDAALRGEQIIREAGSDEPGEVTIDVSKSWRSLIRVQSRAPVDVRIFRVPAGKDPDEAIRAHPEAWPAWVSAAAPPFEFRLEVELARVDRSSPSERLALLDRMAPLLASVEDRTLQAHYLVKLAETLAVNEEVVRARLNALVPAGRQGSTALMREPSLRRAGTAASPGVRAERFALALLIRFPELRQRGSEIDPTMFDSSVVRELYQVWRQGTEAGEPDIPDELREDWATLQEVRLMTSVMTDPGVALEDCLKRMELRRVEEQKRLLTAGLTEGQEKAPSEEADHPPTVEMADRDLEAAVQTDIELGRRLHRLESQLRTGRAPKSAEVETEQDPAS